MGLIRETREYLIVNDTVYQIIYITLVSWISRGDTSICMQSIRHSLDEAQTWGLGYSSNQSGTILVQTNSAMDLPPPQMYFKNLKKSTCHSKFFLLLINVKERLIIHATFLMVDLSLAVNRWDSCGA